MNFILETKCPHCQSLQKLLMSVFEEETYFCVDCGKEFIVKWNIEVLKKCEEIDKQ
jgi:DNA-directed RNA polymerase subunit RPC12/RpoP